MAGALVANPDQLGLQAGQRAAFIRRIVPSSEPASELRDLTEQPGLFFRRGLPLGHHALGLGCLALAGIPYPQHPDQLRILGFQRCLAPGQGLQLDLVGMPAFRQTVFLGVQISDHPVTMIFAQRLAAQGATRVRRLAEQGHLLIDELACRLQSLVVRLQRSRPFRVLRFGQDLGLLYTGGNLAA